MNDKTLDEFIKKLEEKSHRDENDIEFWYARQLQEILEYGSWQNFEKVIKKAQISCETFGQQVNSHFNDIIKMVESGVAPVPIQDYKLSRYACYLIAQNADATKKKIVAFAQTYFAVQTRRQEIEDGKIRNLSEDERRLKLRSEIKEHNKSLASTAKSYGVIEPFDYAIFQNAGYKGLYDGKTKQDIAKHKGLSKKDDILDHMGSVELAANWFRVTQTEEQLKKDGIYGKQNANKTHFEVGKRVRDTMVNKPEELLTPNTSVKQIESEKKKEQKKLEKSKNKIKKLDK
jgi:DNA-damage-inducible protein D